MPNKQLKACKWLYWNKPNIRYQSFLMVSLSYELCVLSIIKQSVNFLPTTEKCVSWQLIVIACFLYSKYHLWLFDQDVSPKQKIWTATFCPINNVTLWPVTFCPFTRTSNTNECTIVHGYMKQKYTSGKIFKL